MLRSRGLPDLANAGRVLAVKLSSFGDIVHVTPCLRALRQACPGAEIVVAVDRTFAPILRHDPHVDRILIANPRLQGGLDSMLGAYRPLRGLGGPRFDLALDFQGRHRSAAWVYVSRARWRGGRGVRRPGWQLAIQPDPDQHAVDVCAAVAEAAGIAVTDRRPRLFPGGEVESDVDALLDAGGAPRRGFLIANPFGIWRSKRWPVDRWVAALLTLQRQLAVAVVLTGSEAERADAAPLAAQLGTAAVSLVGRLSLDQALCVYRRGALMISGDSGPLHAAAALGTPVVALFGPTWPERNGPRGSPARVLQASRPASPGGYHDDAAQAHMRAIEVGAVVDAALALYGDARRAP
jgi:ADP-heptose:LPS heptosyltransferase